MRSVRYVVVRCRGPAAVWAKSLARTDSVPAPVAFFAGHGGRAEAKVPCLPTWFPLSYGQCLDSGAGKQFRTGFGTRLVQKFVRFGSAFDGTRFDPIGPIAHEVRGQLTQEDRNQP